MNTLNNSAIERKIIFGLTPIRNMISELKNQLNNALFIYDNQTRNGKKQKIWEMMIYQILKNPEQENLLLDPSLM